MGSAVVGVCLARFVELLCTLVLDRRPLNRERLYVRTKGVDKALLLSSKGKELKAFTDGSVLEDGSCGFAVYYGEDHALNFHGRVLMAQGVKGDSGLAELAALFWVLMNHPRGQQLSIFSDSLHALQIVQSVSDDPEVRGSGGRKSGSSPRCPQLHGQAKALACAVWWLLRLRTARTSLFKVPGHRGFKQNLLADALAKSAAANGPDCSLPTCSSFFGLWWLLLSFLLRQSPLDGGLAAEAAQHTPLDGGGSKGARVHVRRPKPIGESTEVTHVLALDCEMVGVGRMGWDSRLASVSVVNEFGNQVYFSYAQTTRPVTDYRYKYSGIKREHLEQAPSFAQVQAEVKRLVEGHVIVGHSLENDFKALGFSPPRHMLRDTAHDVRRLLSRGGRPRKLRRITWEFLGMVIQDADNGHDPCEDARAALLLYKRYEKEFEATATRRAVEHAAKQKVRDEKSKTE